MAISFRAAFSDFVTEKTMNACAQEDKCVALLEHIFPNECLHFLIAENSGMLVWQNTEDAVEILAIHTLPESWGSGLGRDLLKEALNQIGNRHIFLWAFKDNVRARHFYEKHGFRWDGSERISEFDGALEVRYVKE